MDNNAAGAPNQDKNNQPEANWQYRPEDIPPALGTPEFTPVDNEPLTWTASEFIAHEKSALWYLALAGVGLALSAGIYFITHGDLIATSVVVLVMIMFGFFAARKPRVLPYRIDDEGLTIAGKLYPYFAFKSFSVIHEGAAFSKIVFWPSARFMPPLNVYYAPEDEQKIVQSLSIQLPMEDRAQDMIDRFVTRIRF